MGKRQAGRHPGPVPEKVDAGSADRARKLVALGKNPEPLPPPTRDQPRLSPPPTAATEVAARIAEVEDRKSPERVGGAHLMLDALRDHLAGRAPRDNRWGEGPPFASVAPSERVPLLRRAFAALEAAATDGILPPGTVNELRELAAVSQGIGTNFDWDDNVLHMDTKVVLFHRDDGRELELGTEEFAVIRKQIGQPGPWEGWETQSGQKDGTFRNFRDFGDPGVFLRDLDRALARGPEVFAAPWFAAFQRAMAHEETARASTIITARGHFPHTLRAGLERMRDAGLIKNVVPLENIYPVSLPGLADRIGGSALSPSDAKVEVMLGFLDRLQAKPFGPAAQRVVPPDGEPTKRPMHLWSFSDDDRGTFDRTVERLGAEIATGRWPDVKVTLHFTGKNHPEHPLESVVLRSDGAARPLLPTEAREEERVLTRVLAEKRRLLGP